MRPNPRFRYESARLWAYVRLISEEAGYSERGTGMLRRYSKQNIRDALISRNLSTKDVLNGDDLTDFGQNLLDYLNYRADSLESHAETSLMDRDEAREHFERLRRQHNPQCDLPMNKQRGEKRHHAFLTCIVNILTEATLGSLNFDSDPRGLTTITVDRKPVRTLSRRMDGAYPSINNPVALWELKEYYGTTTFGSRIADGVYETQLDGLELAELKEHEGIDIDHYLIVDDYLTWWEQGRPYLCRICDMMHMGLVDETLFGGEVLERWPQIVSEWQTPTR